MAAGVYLSEAPSPPRFLFGVEKQFFRVGIWPNYTVYNSCICSPHNPIPSPRYTLYKYIPLYLFKQGRGDGGGG